VTNDFAFEELRAMSSLGEVIRWSTSRQPYAEFVDVIVQDEFNHDVIVRVSNTIYAVFETN
jgi:hypothetical protein